MITADASLIDTVVGVILASVLVSIGWVLRQLLTLTTATATLTDQTRALAAQVGKLEGETDARIERIEARLWGPRETMEPRQEHPPLPRG